MKFIRMRTLVAPLALVAATTGCGSAGGLGDILGGVLNAPAGNNQPATVVAEIQANDARQQMIQIRTESGEQGVVRWDSGTRVVYNNQEYGAAALERGDVVEMRLQQTSDGELYTDYILVRQSVQERTGVDNTDYDTGLVRTDGTVTAVDHETGRFQLRSDAAGTIVVTLPYNATTATKDRFHRLRTGDFVRVEGRYVTQDRFEIVRFY